MITTLAEANAYLRRLGLDTLDRDADEEKIAQALADAAQIEDKGTP